jgi:ribokinase
VNWDITLFVDNLPRPGEELKISRVVSVPGGKGGNTAVASARILGKNQTGIIGMLGSDEIANMQREILLSEGVDVSCLIHQKELASGQAYVIVDHKGENMILTHRAANAALSKDILREEIIATTVKSANLLVVIDPPIEAA